MTYMYFFQPFLEKYLKLQDTCGVHNLHALPGMLGGFTGAIVAAAASESVYGREGWVSDWHTEIHADSITWNSENQIFACLLTPT